MAIIAITTLAASGNTALDIAELEKILSSSSARFVFGTKVQDRNIIQITSEWSNATSANELASSPEYESFYHQMQQLGATTILATMDHSPFINGSAPLIEYVKSDFPASSAPAFKAQIEADFARFESLYRKRGDLVSTGEVFLSAGWTEEQTKGDDKVTSWLVVRGWNNMERFEESIQTEVFKEAIPILMGWGAPFELYHVERRSGREQL
ncbi:hypothetical protein IQ06DRAFT_77689 [Phaeosphaeriaceae sp. SRC1lsM3a]|nr:hypothetical protein IQ06DRAFT_77689 [Stagonospora sp. SRC1lsM3a]